MHNVIILGSGRSGTSMVAGLFRHNGAFQGKELLAPTISNPLGYYEDKHLNLLNNALIERMLRWPTLNRLRTRISWPAHTDPRCYWLAAPRWLRKSPLTAEQQEQMTWYTAQQPFCYKDPRFNVTLHLWEPFLPPDTRYLVIFREPDKTVDSILRDAQELYRPPLPLTEKWGYIMWHRTYERLLHRYGGHPHWMFIHYGQVQSLEAIPAMEAFVDARLDAANINPAISRSQLRTNQSLAIARRCDDLYDLLCLRAECDVAAWLPKPNKKSSDAWLIRSKSA